MSRKIIDKESAEEKLGPDLIDQIASKEWKTATLPSEEELAKEKSKSPKARNNPNSRKNLNQYNPNKSKKVKEKVIKNLTFSKKREDVNPFEYIIVPESYNRNLIMAFIPSYEVFTNVQEEIKFYVVFNEHLQSFDLSELSASDIEDLVSLSMNGLIESRLLISAREKPEALLDISASIEKYRKHSEKLKSGLASRRSDRVDTKAKQNFSIADIVYAYDDEKKREFEERILAMEKEKKDFLKKKKEGD